MTCRGMIVALVLTAFHGSAGSRRKLMLVGGKEQNADATAEQPKSTGGGGNNRRGRSGSERRLRSWRAFPHGEF